jgi:hypothetical protein
MEASNLKKLRSLNFNKSNAKGWIEKTFYHKKKKIQKKKQQLKNSFGLKG